jgi:hypothetical protein
MKFYNLNWRKWRRYNCFCTLYTHIYNCSHLLFSVSMKYECNSMEQSPSLGDIISAGQEISCLLWNSEVQTSTFCSSVTDLKIPKIVCMNMDSFNCDDFYCLSEMSRHQCTIYIKWLGLSVYKYKCVLQFAFDTENPICLVFSVEISFKCLWIVFALFLQYLKNNVY